MKKNNILNSIKIIALGFMFCFGVSYIFAATISPLNVGSTPQDKLGSLGITAGGFHSFGPGLFDDTAVVGSIDNGTDRLIVNGSADFFSKVIIGGGMKVSSLAGNNGKKICVDNTGKLILCPTINGACGGANMNAQSVKPSGDSYLCSSGNPSVVTGTGPWNWTCNGTFGGTTASCSAPVYAICTSGNLTFTSSGTWTVPVGCSSVTFEAHGGGGGGSGGSHSESYGSCKSGIGGAGGGAGGIATIPLTSSSGSVFSFIVGGGGSGSPGASKDASNVNSYCGEPGGSTIIKDPSGNIISTVNGGQGGHGFINYSTLCNAYGLNNNGGSAGSSGCNPGSAGGSPSGRTGGAGGNGGGCSSGGGSGGSGVENDAGGSGSSGGIGGGGGGGAGGGHNTVCTNRHAGGDGGNGGSGYVKITWH